MIPYMQNPGGPTHQQQQGPAGSANMLPNLMQYQNQMGFINPQLSAPYNSNNMNMNMNSRPPGYMNMSNYNTLQQNPHLGTPLLGSFAGLPPQNPGFRPQGGNFSGFGGNGQVGNFVQGMNQGSGGFGQFGGWQGQNVNQLGNVVLNPVQLAALSQLVGCAQGSMQQNGGFYGNQQLGFGQPNVGLQQGNFGQQLPVACPPYQNGLPAQANPMMGQQQQLNNPQNFQGNRDVKQGMHMSNLGPHQNKNFMKNQRSNRRSQKSQGNKTTNPNRKNKAIESANPDDPANQSNKKQRPLFIYTKKEVRKWREQRKKNYPTKVNIQKKEGRLSNTNTLDEAAILRRQQLKEVLAKQAELGLEIAEIPSEYLLDNGDLSHGRHGNKSKLKNGRFQNRFDKRGRFDKTNHNGGKRVTEDNSSKGKRKGLTNTEQLEDNDSPESPINFREPTLLQKLLSTDIKRDNSRLLQALRFMVMNSFFEDWPDSPLNFPKVIVKESDDSDDEFITNIKNDEEFISNIKNELCQEEGEITD